MRYAYTVSSRCSSTVCVMNMNDNNVLIQWQKQEYYFPMYNYLQEPNV